MEIQPQFFTSFKEYPSIEPTTNTKFSKNILKSKANSQNVLWVATQKIHGSNFSIVYDFTSNLAKYARRTDFITKPIPIPTQDVTPFYLENFMDSSKLVNTFHNSLDKIKQNISKKYPEVIGIQIFGEFFGGFWPGGVHCQRRVQLGVYYTPNHEFMVFDIRLFGKDFSTWVEVTQIPQIVEDYLKYVPIYGKGTYEQISQINSEFDSTIPELLGLERLKNNICEGLILRPNKNIFEMKRIVLKKKNKEFLEKAGFGKKDPNQLKQQAEEGKQLVEYLKTFLNANRIESAISKYPDFENQFMLKSHVITDIYADVKKEDQETGEKIKKLKKNLKEFDRQVHKAVVWHLENVRTEFTDRIKNKQ